MRRGLAAASRDPGQPLQNRPKCAATREESFPAPSAAKSVKTGCRLRGMDVILLARYMKSAPAVVIRVTAPCIANR
jgi:hypothetical protein